MEFKTTLEIVTKDIQEIEKLVGNFKNYSRIPNIELDLALSRLRNVYDLLLMFKSEKLLSSEDSDHRVPAQSSATNSAAKLAESSMPADPIPVAPVVPEQKIHPGTPAETPVSPSSPEEAMEKKEMNKKPEEEKLFINEKLGSQTLKKDLSSKLQTNPIKSIAGSLGINDKFFYIRELFAGNAEMFRQTMDELDQSGNFNEAHSLLMSKFQWDMDSEPLQNLLNLVRRKFITSGNE